MQTAAKPLLQPVDVPWQISPSASNLRVRLSEEFRREPPTVDFVGQFMHDDSTARAAGRPAPAPVNLLPAFEETAFPVTASYHLVRVVFASGYSARFSPSVSESSVIPQDDFDWSAIWARITPDGRKEEIGGTSRRAWTSSGICPNPRMYQVLRSPLLAGHDASSPWRHYLLLGCNAYLDVLAQGWTWKLGQPLPGW